MEDYLSKIVYDPTIGKIVAAAVGIAIIITVGRLIKRSLPRYLKESESRYRARKVLTFISYFAIIAYLAIVFSNQLAGLTVALGVAGAGIAFALQEVIASFAGWVALSFGNFYKTGDRVQLGGIKGDVIDIGVLRSTLMEVGQWVNGDLYNGRVVRIANSFVFKEPVFNYSGDFPFLWDEIVVPIKYGSDHRGARTLLSRIAEEVTGDYAREAKVSWEMMVKKYMIEDAHVEPIVTLVANDNWIEFTIRYVVDYKKRRTTKDILFQKILEGIDHSKGKIGLASATFELVGAPRLSVGVKNIKRG